MLLRQRRAGSSRLSDSDAFSLASKRQAIGIAGNHTSANKGLAPEATTHNNGRIGNNKGGEHRGSRDKLLDGHLPVANAGNALHEGIFDSRHVVLSGTEVQRGGRIVSQNRSAADRQQRAISAD